MAVAPALTSLLASSISHTLFLPFFIGGCWLAWEAAEQDRFWMALLGGIAIGLCWWARADGLLVVPTLVVFLLIGSYLLSGPKAALKNTVAFLLGFLRPLPGLWSLRRHHFARRWASPRATIRFPGLSSRLQFQSRPPQL